MPRPSVRRPARLGRTSRRPYQRPGIAVRTTEGDASSLVWNLPAVFELMPDDTHRGQREAQQDTGEPDDEEEEDKEEDDDEG
jgi:hypothetical protein